MESTSIFDRLHPGDGYRIRRIDLLGEISLYVGVYQDGELTNPLGVDPEDAAPLLREWPVTTPVTRGEAARLALLLDALCRYFNTGGDWSELHGVLPTFRRVVVGGLSYDDGYFLLDSYCNTDGNYEHVFQRDGATEVVLWVEDEFIERRELDELYDEETEETGEDGDSEEYDEEYAEEGGDGDDGPGSCDSGRLLSGPNH